MSTTPVEVTLVTPDGLPLAECPFFIQLGLSAYNDTTGVVMPREVEAITDSDGKAVVNLWPSTEIYYLTVEDTVSDAAIGYKFIVPESNVLIRLQDIVVDKPLSGNPYDTEAIQIILAAKATSVAARVTVVNLAAEVQANTDTVNAAMQTVLEVQESIEDIGDDVAAAIAARDVAIAQSNAASISAGNALTQRNAADAAAQRASDEADEAKASADLAAKLLPVHSATPPTDPIANQEWVNTTNGRRYSWLAEDAVWAETLASVMVRTIPSSVGSGSFDVATLTKVGAFAQPVTGTVVIEEGGIAKRLEVDSTAVPITNTLFEGDLLRVKQLDGVERYVSMQTLIAFLASRI